MTQRIEDEVSELDLETQRELAGLEDPPIPSEFALDDVQMQDAQEEETTQVERKPFGKSLFVVIAVGGLMGLILLVVFGFRRTATQTAQRPERTSAEATVPLVQDESAALRSQLAFRDQQAALAQTPQPSPSPEVEESEESVQPPRSRVQREPRPRTERVVVQEVRPQPPPRNVPQPPPLRNEPVREPQMSRPPEVKPPDPVDPMERWAQLAQLGVQSAEVELSTPIVEAQISEEPVETPVAVDAVERFETVIIGSQTAATPVLVGEGEEEFLATPGMMGILNQRAIFSSVSPGTTVTAQVTVPMVWDLSAANSNPSQGRFVVELTQDMVAANGRVAVPKGTQLMVEAQAVSRNNQLVQATAIALISPDTGEFETLPDGAILVSGAQGRPLIAQKSLDVGPELFREDLLVGGLSALGRAGEILNQPTEEFSSASSGDSFSRSVTRRRSNPQLLPALLDGFGTSVSRRIEQRSLSNTQALIDQNTIAVLPEGTPVLLMVNSDLHVAN
ncbi:MAG: TrbI/VirB10 family protein [Desertifilum sp. SIO1I2]|nr:TrbI/VirB10 family protein [Desertifilum sp. SIO1I2]